MTNAFKKKTPKLFFTKTILELINNNKIYIPISLHINFKK